MEWFHVHSIHWFVVIRYRTEQNMGKESRPPLCLCSITLHKFISATHCCHKIPFICLFSYLSLHIPNPKITYKYTEREWGSCPSWVVSDDGDGFHVCVGGPCGHCWCSFSPKIYAQECKLVALCIHIGCETVLFAPRWHGMALHWQHVVLPQSFQVQGPWFLHLLLCLQVI